MKKFLKYGEYYGIAKKKTEFNELKLTETSYKAKSDLPNHSHENAYLCFVIRGNYVEKYSGNEIECSSGEIIAHPAGHTHSDKFYGNESVCFNIEFKDSWFDKLGLQRRFNDVKKINDLKVKSMAILLYKEFLNSYKLSNLSMEDLILELYADTIREFAAVSEKDNLKIKKAEEFLIEHLNQNPSLTIIASYLDIHPVYLARLFKSGKGITIGEYLRKIKVEKACSMLAHTANSLPQIALDCGFFDQGHFTKVFKNYTNVTPLEYRRIFCNS